MRKVVRILIVFSLLVIPQWVVAQSISVSSFKLLESDLTANTTGTMERDQNGEVAALIKVVTTEQGFVFDGGMVGIVKTKQGVGEVWVYVPHGIKKITVQHPQLGVLRDYYFPTTIEKAKTYEMILTTGRVETIVTHSFNKQFVIFNVEPSNAVVELDGEVLTVDSEGYAEKGLPFGTYNYRVSCANYHTEAGQVVLNAQGKAEVKISLRPNFGWIKLAGDEEFYGANVYIDDERVGQLPLTTNGVKSGMHQIKVVKSMYRTYEQQVAVKENETTELSVALIPNFAQITLITDAESEIWVDDKLKGKGVWTGPMEKGVYKVETRRESYRGVSEIVTVSTLSPRTIQLVSPTPIYGYVEITSKPTQSKVYIDGVKMGVTPLILNNVLVGNREVEFVKDGYVKQTRTVNVVENSNNTLSVELSKAPKEVMVNITSAPQSAVVVDGVYAGSTPLNVNLNVGKHHFSLSKEGHETIEEYRNVGMENNQFHYELAPEPIYKLYNSRKYNRSINEPYAPRKNYNKCFTRAGIYVEGNMDMLYRSEFEDGYTKGYGGAWGIYIRGWNLEAGYDMNETCRLLMVRTGWGFNIAKRIIFTPQIGAFGTFEERRGMSWSSYETYSEDGAYPVYSVYSLSCKLQYCLSEVLALNASGDFMAFRGDNPCQYLFLRVGLVLNFNLSSYK